MFPKLWMLCASLAGRRRAIPAPPTMFTALRCGLCTLALIAFVPCDASARKVHEPEIDSEHLFGFTIGSDIGERGEKEIENETNARTGKNGGSYTAIFEQWRQNTQLRRIFASLRLRYSRITISVVSRTLRIFGVECFKYVSRWALTLARPGAISVRVYNFDRTALEPDRRYHGGAGSKLRRDRDRGAHSTWRTSSGTGLYCGSATISEMHGSSPQRVSPAPCSRTPALSKTSARLSDAWIAERSIRASKPSCLLCTNRPSAVRDSTSMRGVSVSTRRMRATEAMA
jgi:hypothetical protein